MQLDEVGEKLGKGELSFNIDKDVVSVGVQTDEPGEVCDDDPDEQVDAGDNIVDQVTNAAAKVMEQQGRVTCGHDQHLNFHVAQVWCSRRRVDCGMTTSQDTTLMPAQVSTMTVTMVSGTSMMWRLVSTVSTGEHWWSLIKSEVVFVQ